MTVTEVLGGLGSWSLELSEECPDEVLQQLGFFGHIAIVRGRVDVEATSSFLLAAARYVGVLRDRSRDRRTIEGDGMLFWLGDEDDKGKVLEAPGVVLNGASLTTAVNAVLPPAVHVGVINSAAGTYTGKHVFETPRKALDKITAAFGTEYRVNGDATIDVGTIAQLYRTTPNTIISAKNAGADLDLVSLGGKFEIEESARDYSSRILLLGQTSTSGSTDVFVTGSANAPSVPYLDRWGNPVTLTRMISESTTNEGSAASRAQLQLNRFNRTKTAMKVTADDYTIGDRAGGPPVFRVGDMAYVYDPANGIMDANRTVDFRGEVIHPDVIRISGAVWPISDDHTVAYRTQAGVWVDLTRWVLWESGGGEITVGDLPKSLVNGGGNAVQDRADNPALDTTIPGAPTGLTLSTSAVVDPVGQTGAIIQASWTAPILNTDGSVITDLSHYLVQWRPDFRAPLWSETVSAGTSTDIPVTPELQYDVRVAAIDRAGHIGDFTAVSSILASADTIAPAAPSDPVVSNFLGQLKIVWDGKTNTGTAMPPDFNRVDVHVSATTGFTPGPTTLVDSLAAAGVSYVTAPYGATRFVKLVAYDHSGNDSAPSGQGSGATTQVVSADVFDGAIGSQKLADLAVINAKIGLLAVNDANVANLSVGKLTAGTMSADVVVGGRFTTALTGARREMNSVGFQGWDASNVLTISLDGVNNLLQGKFRTALSGRRIEMGAAGTLGRIDFYAPDNTNAFINTRTESAGVEAIQLGVETGGGATLWNRINYNSDEWASYRSGNHDFYFSRSPGEAGFFGIRTTSDKNQGSVDRVRLWLDGNVSQIGDPNGVTRFEVGSSLMKMWTPTFQNVEVSSGGEWNFWFDGTTSRKIAFLNGDVAGAGGGASARIQLMNTANWAVILKQYYNNTPGQLRLEVRNGGDTGFEPVYATSFAAQCDVRSKRDLRVPTFSHLTKTRQVAVRQFTRIRDDDAPPLVDELGFLAQEAPDEVVRGRGSESEMIDLTSMLALNTGAIQELADRLEALEARMPGGGRP